MEYFPYEKLREFQGEFIEIVGTEAEKGNNLIVEASTGFGKTACVLASVLPIAMEKNKKIVYLCRTHKQMERVIEELNMITKDHNISALALKGRREMCLSPLVLDHTMDSSSSMYVCRLLRKMRRCNHFNNTREKEEKAHEMEVLFSSRPTFSQDIKEACKQEAFCPYEIAKAVMKNVQVIACSYLYLFEPGIREGFLEGIGVNLEDLIVIMDEAHNLPELAIELGSCQLSLSSLKSGIREAREHNEETIAQMLELAYQAMTALDSKYKLGPSEESRIVPAELLSFFLGGRMPFLPEKNIHTIEEFVAYIVKQGEEIQKEKLKRGKPPRSYVHSCGSFIHNWITLRNRDDFCYLIQKYITKAETESVRLEIVDLDPRNVTTQVTDYAFSTIAMSGTLSPLVAFADTIGLKNYKVKSYPSPFQKENIKVLAVRGVTTKGNQRGLEMYRKISSKAAEVVKGTPKNVGIFTPSYEVLEGMMSAGFKYIVDRPLYVESRGSSSEENDALISEFKDHESHGGAVLLGVLGGRNSEGQDYPGDEMNCVVVIGVPYARPTARVKAKIDYYKKVFPNKGKYYGYFLPAHRKLNQGAGRAHRKLQDKAAIVFLDYRVLQPFVKNDLSEWIKRSMEIVDDRPGLIAERLRSFF